MGAISPLDEQMFSTNKRLLTGRQFTTNISTRDILRRYETWKRTEIRLQPRLRLGPHWAALDAPRTPKSGLDRVNPIPNPCRCLKRRVSDGLRRHQPLGLRASKPSPPQSSPVHPCLLDPRLSKTHCQLASPTS